MKLRVLRMGRVEYQEILNIQLDLLQKRQKSEIDDTLLLVEHPPVITMGRQAKYSDILTSEESLKRIGVKIYEIDRGGEVTYHGPGQIVGYTIIDLKNRNRDVRGFVRDMEEIFIKLLEREYGIKSGRDPKYRGVWVGSHKIAAIGISIKRYITMHGFAFNVNTDLDHFKWIIPCGIRDKGVTSLKDILGYDVNLDKISNLIVRYFCEVFGYPRMALDLENSLKTTEACSMMSSVP